MKKAIALFSMITSQCIGKVLTVLTLLTAGNAAIYFLGLGKRTARLSSVTDSIFLFAVFLVAFFVLSGILYRQLGNRNGHQSYFLDRLRLRKGTVFWNQALYNSLCYFLLFAVEALCLLAMSQITVNRFPERYNHQSVVVACYQSTLLHTVFPLSNWLGWLTNGVICVGLGIFTARASDLGRKGKRSFSYGLMLYCTVKYFLMQRLNVGSLGINDEILMLISPALLGCGSLMRWYVTRGGEEE